LKNLNDEEKEAYYGLYGIPTADSRYYAIPIAKRVVEKYKSGLLELSETEYNWLKKGLVPRASDSPCVLQKQKLKLQATT
jgi:hypothetical protein